MKQRKPKTEKTPKVVKAPKKPVESAQNEEFHAIPKRLTILPLRDVTIYPHMIFPVLIGREPSLRAVSEAFKRDKYIFTTSQSNPLIDEPGANDLYACGTVAKIIQLVRLPNNFVKILVDGVVQGKITRFVQGAGFLEGDVKIASPPIFEGNIQPDKELLALIRHASELFGQYVRVNRNIPPEVGTAFENITDPVRRLYYAAANLQQNVETKQKILNTFLLHEQYFELISMLTTEIEVLRLEQDIDVKVQENIQKTQKRFFIQEQIRALQQELGEDEEAVPELAKLREQLDSSGMPEETLKKAGEELDKLKKTPAMSPDYSVLRNYLELLVSLPWKQSTPDNLDINHARQVLDDDHFGLTKVKERIMEYISVLNLVSNVQGQVLCFVGPPGVGKTSLARSIARALGRKFVRMSLGGVRDEAEIRGHRKTYVGAMPGKIIQSMKRAGTVNPVILLDEVDKMAMDFRGDPSSALLEVLDPEQNVAFSDHYLEVDYDLSKVLFIATANVKYDIPLPLLDRMEIIELSSYLEFEKMEIAQRHLLKKQLERHGLGDFPITFTPEAYSYLIQGYTKEAGVRSLERQIAGIARKIAQEVVYDILRKEQNDDKPPKPKQRKTKTAENSVLTELEARRAAAREQVKKHKRTITPDEVRKYLKTPPFRRRQSETSNKIGVVTGLAWTSMGGDILPVEITMMSGKEKLNLTGKLGDVMKESALAALSFVRSNAQKLGVPENFANEKEIHIHVPEGAIPKDGPSAGITMTMALISAAAAKPARGDVAMTGEVTLRGNILPIGGLNEKLLAAKNAGMTTVLIPKENEPELADMQPEVKEGLTIIPVAHVTEALDIVFPDK